MPRLLRFLLVLPLLLLAGCDFPLPNGPAPTPIVSDPPTATPDPAAPPLPGGRIAFVRVPDGQTTGPLWIIRPDGTGATQIAVAQQVDSLPVWSPDGTRIAYQAAENGRDQIYVVTINPDNTAGTAVLLTATQRENDNTLPAWSPDGTQVVYQSGQGANFQLYVMNADGSDRPRQIADLPPYAGHPAWSPDGTRIAFSGGASATQGREIYTTPPAGGPALRLTGNERDAYFPRWSPDGTAIAFMLRQAQTQFNDVYRIAADGSGQVAVGDSPGDDSGQVWSPDGQWIAFFGGGTNDVYVAPAGGGPAVDVSRSGTGNIYPSWGPDSTYLVFSSNRTGRYRLHLADRTGATVRALTPADGASDERFPVWTR